MNEACMQHGAFGWNELMTSDVDAAKQFYGALFGWETEAFLGAGMPYTLVKVGGEAVGGMMATTPQCEGIPPHWSVYITVHDVDAVARQAEAQGGQVVYPPTDIPTVGRFCVLQDPQGATLGAITYRKP